MKKKSSKKILLNACKHNNINKVKKALMLCIINNIYIDKETILLNACIRGYVKLFELLLNHFVDNNCDIKTILEYVGCVYIKSYTDKINVDVVNCLLKYCIVHNVYNISICSDAIILKLISRNCLLHSIFEYRCIIKQPFDILEYAYYIFREIIHSISEQTMKLLFDYGEKINIKLNARELAFNYMYEYFVYLIKHNYTIDTKNIEIYFHNKNLVGKICVTKNIFTSSSCFFDLQMKYEAHKNNIRQLNIFHGINYILCISTNSKSAKQSNYIDYIYINNNIQ